MILRPGQCPGCRELQDVKRLASEREAEAARLRSELEALTKQGAPHDAAAAASRRLRRRLFDTPSITDLPVARRRGRR
jgi:hypothetical protein